MLWVTGVLPMVLDAMDDVQLEGRRARDVSLRNLVEGALTARHRAGARAVDLGGDRERKLLASGSGHDLSMRKMAANAMRAVLLFVGLLFALSAVGIDLTALSVLGGALGVGLGFGLQKIAANYVSGFVILAERSLRIGDMVKVDNFEGRITDIRTRYTVIRALNGRESIVPNETLITHAGRELLARRSARADARRRCRSPTAPTCARCSRKLEAAIAAVPRVIADPAPSVQLAAFAADGMELTIDFWIRDPENGQGNVKSRRQPRGARRARPRRASRSRSRSASSTPSSRASRARRPTARSRRPAAARPADAIARPAQEPAGSERRCR